MKKPRAPSSPIVMPELEQTLAPITSGVALTPDAQEAFDRDDLGRPPATSYHRPARSSTARGPVAG